MASRATLKEPRNLSPRIKWLRDFYFSGREREWNNEFLSFSTGAPWDICYEEIYFYTMLETLRSAEISGASVNQAGTAHIVPVPDDFYDWSLVERKAWFTKEVMVHHVPQEILPGDLLAGGRFNLRISRCLSKRETEERARVLEGPDGFRARLLEYNFRGFGSLGPTPGHFIPGHEKVVVSGFRGQYEYMEGLYANLTQDQREGQRGAQLRAMMTACAMPRELAAKYSALCGELAEKANTDSRRQELLTMSDMLKRVPWEGASNFWEAVASLWIQHMLIMSDENYAGPGVSFGRLDQYLYPYWRKSLDEGMDREFGKEILKCFFVHCNTAYDAAINLGNNQGITAGFGQLFSFSGMGKGGVDLSNDLTYALMDVIEDMTPLLEPKPNVRLHRNSPDALLDRVVELVSQSQGAPFLINFDERSAAGMLREARESGSEEYINLDNVHDYASVGCMENTMVGNDRSETVNNNLNLIKAVELTLGGGEEIAEYRDVSGKPLPRLEDAPKTGDPRNFGTFDEFYAAFETQLKGLIKRDAALYNVGDMLRSKYSPVPYTSIFFKGCAESGKDVVSGGPELRFCTIEGVTFGSTVDSLLAVKYLVYDNRDCTMNELIAALKADWKGYEVLQAKAKNKAPKYGRDDDEADAVARRVMDCWADEAWEYRTEYSDEQFRGGMLSWNYWVTYAGILFSSPDGRKRGQFLSNAICPSNGADINGPTSNTNSVGKVLGGKDPAAGDYEGYLNNLPNGASHTITFSPAMIRDPGHKEKFKSFLRGYTLNGGTALQINILDPDMLRDAQKSPEDYRSLLVRVTGYNAYFTSIGKELQNEIIARESHNKW
ncbi:MAG: hypothetical protein LBL51_00835 [Synergistaceae bacterium]|jgi:formate C-acetyltransferase|nr:hypothetical protein [Synergistaceae bacterium]